MVLEHEEEQYLNLIRTILERGEKKMDRTGTGTLSITGAMMRFSLANNTLPLLTTKKVNYKAVLEELLFFIKGQTHNKFLQQKCVKIWNGNSSKEYLESIGIDREEGDLGPVYGFQWRHFGAPYKTWDTDYTNQGIDQLANVINEIKSNPSSRRLIVCSWNPIQLPEMALPPCHLLYQFTVTNGKLNCVLYQRSADMGLGVPFNIASYAALTYMVAYITGLQPGEFVHFICDCHVYLDHVDALKEQIQRKPRPFPSLYIKPKGERKNIEDFEYEDFIIEDYDLYPPIYMKMSV